MQAAALARRQQPLAFRKGKEGDKRKDKERERAKKLRLDKADRPDQPNVPDKTHLILGRRKPLPLFVSSYSGTVGLRLLCLRYGYLKRYLRSH